MCCISDVIGIDGFRAKDSLVVKVLSIIFV